MSPRKPRTTLDIVKRAYRHQIAMRDDESCTNPHLHKMLAAIDNYIGQPGEDTILAIAWRYCEYPCVVRIAFETREDRQRATHRAPRSGRPGTCAPWMQDEESLVLDAGTEPDRVIAGLLNALPCNVSRQVKRTAQQVRACRRRLRTAQRRASTHASP